MTQVHEFLQTMEKAENKLKILKKYVILIIVGRGEYPLPFDVKI